MKITMLVDLEGMMSWIPLARRVSVPVAAAWVLACGGGSPTRGEEPAEMAEVPPATTPDPQVKDPPEMESATPPVTDVTPPGATDMTPPDTSSDDPDRCRPGAGVSGSPRTIPEAIELINSLPKPTSLACFLQSLERPLTLFMTESDQSLQPATGPESPRTFVLRDDLEMSIVFDGEARNTLEFGYRTSSARSIKAEILFPVRSDVSAATLFERIQVSPRNTVCGACHVAEVLQDFPGFPNGVFESEVFEPFSTFEVELDSLKAEVPSCDQDAEPDRCELLSALLDHGETVQGRLQDTRE